MNEFVEQFLIECRELVEQATTDLLALEQSPGDRARLDSAFRAFHTLKGSAGIIDFDDMARALHAAEDVLAEARAAAAPVSAGLIGHSLACLDQVEQWLDVLQATGEPPRDPAAADAIIARFARAARAEPIEPSPGAATLGEDLLAQRPELVARARSAFRYTPHPECFFQGEDPLAAVETLPGLLALDIQVEDGVALESLDPFTCRLVLTGLCAVEAPAVATALAPMSGAIETRALTPPATDEAAERIRAVLEAQRRMLTLAEADGRQGRQVAAATVAAHTLRRAGRAAEADRILALASTDGAGLLAALTEALDPAQTSDTPPVGPAQPQPPPPERAARGLRIDTERVDALVRLTGELTVVKNAVGHLAGLAAQPGVDPKTLSDRLKAQQGLLERLVEELQRAVLAVRVLPMGHVFQRFPRLVRDMGASLGKPVRLVAEGEATQADKAVVEALFEPLLHVLRNAVDHGLEPTEARAAAGKASPATIHLRAERRGEHVIVEVADDGCGVDLDRVREVAFKRGLVSAEALAALGDQETLNLIFAPGFSTAKAVSDLSGRGVGMDAVRSAIERLGGEVRMESRAGQGSTVRFTLPFTVLMTRVITVEAGGQMFGLPLECVVETVRISRARIAPLGAGRAFVFRDRTLPLIELAERLGVVSPQPEGPDATVVIAALNGQATGLEVDRVGGRMEVMLRPLEGLLAGAPGIAGTTVLGDGRVLIVLDPQELTA
jgi:two-component system chemotaxis sensor kinase CheA